MEKKVESKFLTEMQYNSNTCLRGSETRGQTKGPNIVNIVYFLWEIKS